MEVDVEEGGGAFAGGGVRVGVVGMGVVRGWGVWGDGEGVSLGRGLGVGEERWRGKGRGKW